MPKLPERRFQSRGRQQDEPEHSRRTPRFATGNDPAPRGERRRPVQALGDSGPARVSHEMQQHLGNKLVQEALNGGGGELGAVVSSELGASLAGVGPGVAMDQAGGLLTARNQDLLRALSARQEMTRGEALNTLRGGGGHPLPRTIALRLEREFGTSFDSVRIHTDDDGAATARALGARAVQKGESIFFAKGAYAPDSVAGLALLRHELTHVVQAREGRLPTTGQISDPQMGAEREAVGNEGGVGASSTDGFVDEDFWHALVDATAATYLGGAGRTVSGPDVANVGAQPSLGAALEVGSSMGSTPSWGAMPSTTVGMSEGMGAESMSSAGAPAMLSPDSAADIDGGSWYPSLWTGSFDEGAELLSVGTDLADSAFAAGSAFAESVVEGGTELFEGIWEAGADLGEEALLGIVQSVSPLLADLVVNGPDRTLSVAMEEGLDGFFQQLCGMEPEALLEEVGGTLGDLATALEGREDPCAFLGERLGGLDAFVTEFLKSDAFENIQAFLDSFDQQTETLNRLLLAPMFDAVLNHLGERFSRVRALVGAASEAAGAVQAVSSAAWQWLLDALGLGAEGEGLGAWLMEKARAVWGRLADELEPLKAPIELLRGVLLAASPFGVVLLAKEGLGPLLEAARWLMAHADDPNLVQNAREELGETWLPALLSGLELLEKHLASSVQPILGYLSQLKSGLEAVAGAITGVASRLTAYVRSIAGAVVNIIDWTSTTWASVTGAIAGFAGQAIEALKPVLSVLGSLGLFVVGFPATSALVVAGRAWPYLCPCLRKQILEVMLNVAITALHTVELPGAMGAFQGVVVAFFEGLRGRLESDEASVLVAMDNLALVLSGGSPEFLVGFVGGLVVGVLEGLFDPLLMVWDVLSVVGQIQYWALCMATGDTASGLDAAHAIGDDAIISLTEDARQALTPELMQRFAELADRLAPIGASLESRFMPAVEALLSGEGVTWETLQEHLGTLGDMILEGLETQAAGLANSLIDVLQDPKGMVGSTGYGLGWLAGSALVHLVATVCSFGTLEAVLGTSKVARSLLKALDMSKAAIGKAGAVLGQYADEALALVKQLGQTLGGMAKGVLGELLELAAQGFDEVARFVDDVLGLLFRRGSRRNKVDKNTGDMVSPTSSRDAGHGQNPTPAGTRSDPANARGNSTRNEQNTDRKEQTNEHRAARAAAKRAWADLRAQTEQDLVSEVELRGRLSTAARTVQGATIRYGLIVDRAAWCVEAVAHGDPSDPSARERAGRGWVARHGASTWLGATSAVEGNRRQTGKVLDALEVEWDDLCASVEGDEDRELQAFANALARDCDGSLEYPTLDLTVDVKKPEFTDKPSVVVVAEVSPNTTTESRTLVAGARPSLLQWLRSQHNTAKRIDGGLEQALAKVETSLGRGDSLERAEPELIQARPSLGNPFNTASTVNQSVLASVNDLAVTVDTEEGVETRELPEYLSVLGTAVKGSLANTVRRPIITGPVLQSPSPAVRSGGQEWTAIERWLEQPDLKKESTRDLSALSHAYQRIAQEAGCSYTHPEGLGDPERTRELEGVLKTKREALRLAVAEAYGEDLPALNREILENNDLFKVTGMRLKGAIFEQWFGSQHEDLVNLRAPYIPIVDGTGNRRICADGFVEGTASARGNTLVECKAYSSAAPPDKEQVRRMREYRKHLGKSWMSGGGSKMVFNTIVYVFNSAEVADAWIGKLDEILESLVSVMVGGERLVDALASLDDSIELENED